MSGFDYILDDDEKRDALVKRRVASLLQLYTKGRLSEKGEVELRTYLGGRLPHEDAPPLPEQTPPPSAPIAQEAPVAATISSVPHTEPDRAADRAAWLLRSWLHRAANAGEISELQQLFPHAPNLVGHLTRATYKRPLIEYARALGYKADATLKRWLDDGRACDPPDLPPFDAPGQLAAWWERVKKRKIPDELLAVATAPPAASAPVPTESVSGTAPPAARAENASSEAQQSQWKADTTPMHEGTGFSASLERARQNERQAARALYEARQRNELGPIRVAQDTWNKAFQELRRAEMDAASILTASGEMVRWPEVEGAVMEKLGVVNQAVRSLMTRVATKVTLPPELLAKVNRVFQEELDRIFEDLDKSDFREPYKLAA